MFKTIKEKIAFKAGMAKQRRLDSSAKSKNKSKSKAVEKPRYLGPTCVNGEYWDTNFKKPYKFTKDEIRELHEAYDFEGKKRSDAEVVNSFVLHMRRKYGTYDEDGKFLGLLSDNSNSAKRKSKSLNKSRK